MLKNALYCAWLTISLPPLDIAHTSAACKRCERPHRQFDFWLEDWKAAANQKASGLNSIVLLHDSCIIQETMNKDPQVLLFQEAFVIAIELSRLPHCFL